MDHSDIRWRQRFSNFSKALSQLEKFIEKFHSLNDMEKQGLIQAFEYTFELAWNVIKDYYEYQGVTQIQGSRDAFRLAFNRGLVLNGERWMLMIESRTKTAHTYNEQIANQIAAAVAENYIELFRNLRQTMAAIAG